MVKIRDRIVGIILVILGILPFLFNIDLTSDFLTNYEFLEYIEPGKTLYQIIIILLGVWLIWPRKKHHRT